MKAKENLTSEEVAALLDMPLVTIQRWEHQGKIPCRIAKQKKCFRRKEILEWAAEHGFKIKSESNDASSGIDDILYPAIKRGGIYYELAGNDIIEVFESAVNKLPFLPGFDREMIFQELLNREELASTGIGHGIAIPHTRERLQMTADQAFIPVFFLRNKIEFNAIDGHPVDVLFMIFTRNPKEHLMVLSRISHTLKDRKILNILTEKNKKKNLLDQILKIEQEFHK
jgi:PTS system nitrogen regulatory IIA component